MDQSAPGIGRLYRELWRFAEGRRIQLVASFALLIGSQLAKLAIPALAGTAINTMQSQGLAGAGRAGTLLALVFFATVVSWLLHGPGRILERNVALAVRQKLSAELMDRLFAAPLVWHEAQHGVETGHRVQQSTNALYDFAQSQFIYLQSATSLIGPVIALWVISAWVGLAASIGYVVLGVIIVLFDRVMMRLGTAENAADRRYWSSLSDALVNILSIFALKMRAGVLRLVEARLQAVFEPVRRSIVYNEAKWASVDLLNAALWIALVALYVWLSIQAEDTGAGAAAASAGIPLGNLFMVYEYALQAGGVITGIAAHFQSLTRQRTDFASAAPLWSLQKPDREEEPAAPFAQDWGELQFGGLDYSHPRAPRDGAEGKSATIRDAAVRLVRGRSYALIGPSGSGKTTLLRLLAGLYRPDAGRLSVDHGRHAVESQAMARVLQSMVTLLPQGVDSPVAARGGNLSGGQLQRIAIARALMAAAPSSVLLLDEPTSALDPATEAALIGALLAARGDACILASIHRPQLLASFDEVLVVSGGRVVDQGTVDELRPRCAELSHFLRLPSSGPPA